MASTFWYLETILAVALSATPAPEDPGAKAPAAGSEARRVPACAAPDRPSTEVKEMTLVANRYVHGYTMCVVRLMPQYCRTCKKNWRHRCGQVRSGEWHPVEPCLPGEIDAAKAEIQERERREQRDLELQRMFGLHAGDLMDASARGASPQDAAAASASAGGGTTRPDAGPAGDGDANPSPASLARCGEFSPDISDIVRRMDDAASIAGQGRVSDMAIAQGQDPNARRHIRQMVALCGSLGECIRLSQLQIQANDQSLAGANCSATPVHAATCEVIRLSSQAERRQLAWLRCHAQA